MAATGASAILAQRMPRVDALTGLRWCAAFFVFTYHMLVFAPLPDLASEFFRYGFFGVTFFFVLSGFVLTWSASDRVSQSTFYWRRFARIYPSHFVALLLAIPVFYSLSPNPAESWVKPLSVGILALSFVLLQGWSKDPAILFSGNPAAWTLSCEAFFYVLHPYISKVLTAVRVRGSLVFAASVIIIAFGYRGLASAVPEAWFSAISLPIVYLTEFAVGMALAWAFRSGWRPRIPVSIGLGGLVLCIAAFVLVPRYAPNSLAAILLGQYSMELFTVTCALAVAAFASRRLEGRRSIFASRLLVRLGDWSYAFYLVHATFIYIALSWLGVQPTSWRNVLWYAVLLVVGLIAAAALHHGVEKPLERRMRAWKDARAHRGQSAKTRAVSVSGEGLTDGPPSPTTERQALEPLIMDTQRILRVVIASRIFSPEPSAASFALEAIARRFRDAGHQVTVLTTTSPKHLIVTNIPGVRVKRAPVIRDSSGYLRGYLPYLSFDIPLFVRLLLTKRADLYIVEPPPTTGAVVRVAMWFLRRPYAYDAADIWSDAAKMATSSKLVIALLRSVELFAFRGASHAFAASDGVAVRMRELGIHTPTTTIGFGVDTDTFTFSAATEPAAAPYFIYAGSYSEWHGAAIFIDAFAEFSSTHPEYRLIFVGNGSERSALEKKRNDLALDTVDFMDPVDGTRLNGLLADATASLASLKPGQGYDYAFTTKVYSSIAAGCPVIFTGIGPTEDFMNDAANTQPVGIAVPYTTAAVVSAMNQFAENPVSSKYRVQLSKWTHERFSLRSIADAVMQTSVDLVQDSL